MGANDDDPVIPERAPRDRALIGVATLAVLLSAGAIVLIALILRDDSIPTYGPSMKPTLAGRVDLEIDGDAYDDALPRTGDIVGVMPPVTYPSCDGGICATVGDHLIKRIVAIPGETISFTGAGRAVVDGVPSSEPFIHACSYFICSMPPVTLGPGEYFLAGDNRNNSIDSRDFGPVPLAAIEGRIDLNEGIN
jgi:signal peptidase I